MSINDYSKEELELLSYKDITNKLLEEFGAMSTKDLFKKITELLDLPNSVFENKIGDYYTTLTTDKRFIVLSDGTWDLRDHHTSDKISVVVDDDDENEEELDMHDDNGTVLDDSNFDDTSTDEEFDDDDDDLKDLVIMDEDELELEQ